MKLIDVPHIGPRPADEFVYGGPRRDSPDPATCADDVWADHVFNRRGEPHRRVEWWYHRPTASWLVVERDTACDESFDVSAVAPDGVVSPGGHR